MLYKLYILSWTWFIYRVTHIGLNFRDDCTGFLLSVSTSHSWLPAAKENRIYIRVEFTRKKSKTAILLYCFHTAGVLHIFVLYILLGPGTSFYRKSKINIQRKPNYEIGWFHNWPMIISFRLYAFHLTNDNFRYNYKSNAVFIHLIHYKVHLTV